MKKFLVIAGTILAFVVVEVIFDTLLGITFPSSTARALHDILVIVFGGVLVMILSNQI